MGRRRRSSPTACCEAILRTSSRTAPAAHLHPCVRRGSRVLAALRAQLPAGLTPLNIGTPWVMTIGEMATELSREQGGPPPVVTGEYPGDDGISPPTVRPDRPRNRFSPTCQRWSPEQPLALTSRLRDEDQLSASVSVLDDLVRLRCSLERERLEFDHQLALFQQFGRP